MIVSMHQPNHLPWVPWFEKLAASDLFVILHCAPYSKGGYLNRQRIPGPRGDRWLTVPLRHMPLGTSIMRQHAVDGWRARWWAQVESAYAGAPYWTEYRDGLRAVVDADGYNLAAINIDLITRLVRWLDIATPMTFEPSPMALTSTGAKRVLDICKGVGADVYLAGQRSREYLDLAAFERAGIEVRIQDPGPQRYHSALEMLLYKGPAAAEHFRGLR